MFRDFKEEYPALHRRRSEDPHTPRVVMEDTKVTLSELVAEIMHVSTTPSGRYFNPPPEAHFISNKNISTHCQALSASVTPSEEATGHMTFALKAHLFRVVKIPDLNNIQVNTRQTVQQNISLERSARPQIHPIFWIQHEFHVEITQRKNTCF